MAGAPDIGPILGIPRPSYDLYSGAVYGYIFVSDPDPTQGVDCESGCYNLCGKR